MIPPKEDRIAFWKYSYARASFVQAHRLIAELITTRPELGSLPRLAMTMAIASAYARPFKQRRLVRLSDDVIPDEYRETHNEMIEIRDKVIAHRDLDAPMADWGFVNQLRVTIGPGGSLEINTLSPSMPDQLAEKLSPLLLILIQKMEHQTEPFRRDYFAPPPSPNVYVVSLDENPSEWLIPAD